MLVPVVVVCLLIACSGNTPVAAQDDLIEYVSQTKNAWFLEKALDAYPLHLHGQSQYDTDYNLTAECLRSLEVYQHGLLNKKEWAVLMMDADGVPMSGMLDGNLKELGYYEECKRVKATGETLVPGLTHDFDAKYCRANMGSQFYTSAYGVCVPELCTRDDVLHMLAVGNNSKHVTYAYCGEKTPFSENGGAILAAVIVSIFVVIIVCATATDYYLQWHKRRKVDVQPSAHPQTIHASEEKAPEANEKAPNGSALNGTVPKDPAPNGEAVDPEKNEQEVTIELQNTKGTGESEGRDLENIEGLGPSSCAVDVSSGTVKQQNGKLLRSLLAFSLLHNVPRVLSTDMPPGAFRAFHGIRFLSMTWILLGHVWYFSPFTIENVKTYQLMATRWTHQSISSYNLAVDPFFLLSSCLVTITFIKQLDRQDGKLTIRQMVLYYVHRYWRLTPVYGAIIMVWATTSHYWTSSPISPEEDIDNCKEVWWTNLLYINNFYKYEERCMVWTWYLAVDFQYYVIAPLFVFVLYKFTVPGSVFLFLGYCGSLTARAVLHHDDSTHSHRDIYIKPWTRFGPYAIGIGLGCILYRTKCKVKLPALAVVAGWLVAIALCLLAVYGTYDIQRCAKCWDGYFITHHDVFALGIAWLMFACCTGYGGVANTFLSWTFFVPLARLTFVAYLIHPILIIFYNVGIKSLVYMEDLTYSMLFCGHVLLTVGASLVITLVFEVPMLELEKIFLPGRRK